MSRIRHGLLLLCVVVLPATHAIAQEPNYKRMPWHLVDLWWDLGEKHDFQSYSIDVEISKDLPNDTRLYIAPIGIAHLNDVPFYGGIQTRSDGKTKADRRLRVIGPGFLMSMWGEREFDAIRPAEGGLCESSGHEGDFVSVRRPFDWSAGRFTFRVVKMDEELVDDKQTTWVGAFVHVHQTDENIFIGGLRFPTSELKLSKNVASFVEVYGPRIPTAEIPKLTVRFGNLKINNAPVEWKKVDAIYPKGVPDFADATADENWVKIVVGEEVSRERRRVTVIDHR